MSMKMKMKQTGKALLNILLSLTLTLSITLVVAVLLGGVWVMREANRDIAPEFLTLGTADRTTRLYYYDDAGDARELTNDRISGHENAIFCPLEEIPKTLQDAFIAIEDKRFYEHGGIDWFRTASAAGGYLRRGRDTGGFGGSTLTQQLVKNLTGENERSVKRKVSEMMRAVQLEKDLTKSEILERYLNVVNLSENCYGVRTASNAYFSKEPQALTLDECATIAAITNNPARYDPIRHPKENRKRRDVILSAMLEQGKISKEAYEEVVKKDTTLCINREALSGRINSWYADMVSNDVIAALMKEKRMSRAEASRLVYRGGLKIYTAMEPKIQRAMERYYEDTTHFPTHENGEKAQSAMMIVNPKNGDILGVVGAVGGKDSNRIQNFATDAKRPSGSVIKPLSVYLPAIEGGLVTSGTVFDDVPLYFKKNGAPWPRNSPNIYRGLTTVSTALTHSVNTVSLKVLGLVGKENSMRFLRETLGMTSLDPQKDLGGAALALGQQHNGLTLREILGGYTPLANEGIYCGTRSYYKVLDANGNLLLHQGGSEKRAASRESVAIMTQMLRNVTEEGTGKALKLKDSFPIASKTGTSSRNCDKWFVGYTPELLAGVWYGFDYPHSLADVKGNPALSVWDAVMKEVLALHPPQKTQFETPPNVVAVRYCRDSGKRMADACRYDPRGDRSQIGYFKKGTEPQECCECHVLCEHCRGGGMAGEYCPLEERETVALIRVNRNFPRQIHVRDAAYTYGGTPTVIGRNLSDNEPYYFIYGESNRHIGIEMGTSPYNRLCPLHRTPPTEPPLLEGENDGSFEGTRGEQEGEALPPMDMPSVPLSPQNPFPPPKTEPKPKSPPFFFFGKRKTGA